MSYPNIYSFGQCTWGAANLHNWVLRYGNLGNARDWAANWRAQGGFVGMTPAVGTIACFQPGSNQADAVFGHVAAVISVTGKQFAVDEMNGPAGPGHYDDRTCIDNPGVSFLYENDPTPIHSPGALMKATLFQGPDSTFWLFVPTGRGQFIPLNELAVAEKIAADWGISSAPIALNATDVAAWRAAYPPGA